MYTCCMYTQKRLIINLTPEEHKSVARWALEMDMSISNMVRRLLGLPEVQRGPGASRVEAERPADYLGGRRLT